MVRHRLAVGGVGDQSQRSVTGLPADGVLRRERSGRGGPENAGRATAGAAFPDWESRCAVSKLLPTRRVALTARMTTLCGTRHFRRVQLCILNARLHGRNLRAPLEPGGGFHTGSMKMDPPGRPGSRRAAAFRLRFLHGRPPFHIRYPPLTVVLGEWGGIRADARLSQSPPRPLTPSPPLLFSLEGALSM